MESDIIFILAGDDKVGKSVLAQTYVRDVFVKDYIQTIGGEFHDKTIKINGKQVSIDIWELGGHKKYRSIMPRFLEGAHIIGLTFDITNRSSFHSIKTEWYDLLK
jgi:small GTP-binding protein